MYQRAPKSPETVNRPSRPEEPTFAEQQRFEKRRKLLATTALLLVPVSTLAHYAIDTSINREREQAATISIETNLPGLSDYPTASTTFIDGYGSMNATYLAGKFGAAIQQIHNGPVQSANFSDAPIDAENLAKSTVEKATLTNIDHAVLFGFSAGGILAAEAAEKIVTDEASKLDIDVIYLAATPTGPESLREGQIENIEALNYIADTIPGARYSSAVRFLISMVSDVDQYKDGGVEAFIDVWRSNLEELQKRSEPGVRQLDDQTLAIMNADLNKNFEAIATQRGKKQMPVIVYLAAADPTSDRTVDTEKASEITCEAARAHGFSCTVLKVPNAVHSVYAINAETYQSVLSEAKPLIESMVAKERLRYEAAQEPSSPYTILYRPQ